MASNPKPYSVDKSLEACEKYKFTLPELYRDLAKEELRENDVVRENALAEMRQWIVENPHIRKCRMDAKFLLRFLRFREFSVPMACEALERYLTIRALYPSLFENLDCNEPIMKELIERQVVSYLGQDRTGRGLYLLRFGEGDPSKHTPLHMCRYMILILETVLESEEFQIGGYKLFVDYGNCTMAHFESWGTSEMRIMMDIYNGSFPLRYGETHAAALPKFAVSTINTFLTFANPKLREKVTCYKTTAEFEKHFEPSLKPSLYGGVADLNTLNRDFRKRIEDQRSIVLAYDQMEIDVAYYGSKWEFEEPSSEHAVAEAILKH